MKKQREEFKSLGIDLESRYLIYRKKDKIVAIPYNHIIAIELKGERVSIQTGGLEKITIQLPSDHLASLLFEELLLQVEKTYL